MGSFEFTSRYLRGDGIEIGASNMPIEVDRRCAKVRYVDRLSAEEIAARFPELEGELILPVDIQCDLVTEGLAPFRDASLDFVIASHVLEHIPDPLGFLVECHRVLRDSGVVYLGVPDKEHTFDKDRDRTLLDHVVQDFRDHKAVIDEEHLIDYLVNAADTQLPDDPEQRRAIFATELERSFHVHVWTWRDVMEILVWQNENGLGRWDLLDLYLPKGIKNEMIFMLTKSLATVEEAAIRFTSSAEQLIRREEIMQTLISAGQQLARTDPLSRLPDSSMQGESKQVGTAQAQ